MSFFALFFVEVDDVCNPSQEVSSRFLVNEISSSYFAEISKLSK
jgi:hypothetical protein